MLVTWRYLNGLHQCKVNFKKGEERKRRRLAVEKEREVTSWAFSAYGRHPEMVTSFRYLGRVVSAADKDWLAVIRNMEKAQAVQKNIIRILIREGERPRVSGFFFKAFVQSVLLFGAETWVVNPYIGRVLGGLQDHVAQQLTERILRRRGDRKWEYSSVEAARAEVGFETMETYICRR